MADFIVKSITKIEAQMSHDVDANYKFNSKSKSKIIALIVTYNPSHEKLIRIINLISPQVDHLIVIDNGSSNATEFSSVITCISDLTFISLSRNFGIAYAQNVGIRNARDLNAKFVLTLDQDSIPSTDMVSRLESTHINVGSSSRVAAVGPLLTDEDSKLPLPFFLYVDGRKKRFIPSVNSGVFDVEFLISSGTLISMEALEEIGLMREELFISYVDVEFCLRARAAGFRIIASSDAAMKHNLGDRRLRLGRSIIPLHSPLRHYYLMRGGIYMQKLDSVPRIWKRWDRIQLIRSFLLFSFMNFPQIDEITSMVRGIIAGLKLKVNKPPSLDLSS